MNSMMTTQRAFGQQHCCKPFTAAANSRIRARAALRASCAYKASSQETQSSLSSKLAAGLLAAALGLVAQPSLAAFRLPPLDSDPNRCERAYTGNTIGQANAVSDKILDLRKCDFHGKNLSAKVLSGALVSDADFSESTLVETVMTKAYARGANFEGVACRSDQAQSKVGYLARQHSAGMVDMVQAAGANLTNAVLDRVDFTNANLKGAKFHNAVVTGVIFDKADLSGTSFDEALIGNEDAKHLQVPVWKLFSASLDVLFRSVTSAILADASIQRSVVTAEPRWDAANDVKDLGLLLRLL